MQRLSLLLGLWLSIVAAFAGSVSAGVSKATTGHCEPGWQRGNEKCYRLLNVGDGQPLTSLIDLRSQCQAIGAELLAPDGCLPMTGCDSGRGAVCVKPFSNCAVGWYESKRACYQLNGNQLSWDESKTACNQMGGDLIQIIEEETQKFVNGYLPPFVKQGIPYIWIGIYQADRSKPLSWTSGPEVNRTYNNWADGEPRINMLQRNAGRVRTSSDSGVWEIGRPTESSGFICELPLGAIPIIPTPDYRYSCSDGWQLFRKNCYFFNATGVTWQSGRDSCRRVGSTSDLVDIRDPTEQEFVQRNLNGRDMWLGLYSKPEKWGDWFWNDDDSTATYFNWNDGEPNNEGSVEFCVDMSPNGRWNDRPCASQKSFSCKRSADVNGSPPTPPPTTPTPRWDPMCGVGWFRDPISSMCYMINMEPMKWNDARLNCQSKQAELASITSLSDKSFITSQIQAALQANGNALAFWIGLNDLAEEGRWIWSDNSPVPFINWDYGQPSSSADTKDCALILPGKSFFWNNENCNQQFPSVCKKPANTGTTIKPDPTTISVPGGQLRGCPTGYSGFNNMCYRFYTDNQKWNDARQQCKNDGGDLVSMENKQEHGFVYELVQRSGSYEFWIGLQDSTSSLRTMYFQWSDGSPVTFTYWNKGEPNDWQDSEDCVSQLPIRAKGMWSDVSCNNQLSFVCKRRQVALVTTPPTTRPVGCPFGYDDAYNGNCYRYVVGSSRVQYTLASSLCRSSGGTLVSILSSEEQGHLNLKLSTLNTNQSFWIGLYSSGPYYYWSSGGSLTSTSYTNWATGANVKSSYTFMYSKGRAIGTWSMESSLFTLPNYICKRYQEGPPTTRPPPTTYDPKFCAAGWLESDNTCFRVFKFLYDSYFLTWSNARVACKSLGGDLASIHSVNTTAALRSLVNVSYANYWIGLNSRDTSQGYKWIDGTSPNYFNWKQNEPNNFNKKLNCVLLDPTDMKWYVTSCSGTANYICETPKGINPGNMTTVRFTTQPNYGCYWNSRYFRGSCYYITGYPYSWQSARLACRNSQGELASITDDEENEFIHNLAAQSYRTQYFWIGLNELGLTDGYKWSDGTAMSYLNWKRNEPNNAGGAEHCVNMHGLDGLWSDENCALPLPSVCKINNATRVTTPKPTPIQGLCPKEFFTIGDNCYRVFSKSADATTWKEALNLCSARGGVNRTYLASIPSYVEQSALTALIADAEVDLWIGLYSKQQSSTSRKYLWNDNSEFKYDNWDRGEPNGNANNSENCVVMYSQKYRAGKWNDIRCELKRGYICMTNKQPNILTTWPGPQPTKVLCSADWVQFGSSCFKYFNKTTDWKNAVRQCQSQGPGANLASIHDVWELNQLVSLTGSRPTDPVWIGLYANATTSFVFSWIDGWPVLYTNWDAYQPNLYTGCGRMQRTGKWYSSYCEYNAPYLCRISYGLPPTTPPTILGSCPSRDYVQYGQYCYWISDPRYSSYWMDFASAQLDCKLKGGDLASITTPGEQDFLAQAAAAKVLNSVISVNFWIGMTRQLGNGFQWMDASPLNYVHWADGEPSDKNGVYGQNCVEMYQSNYQWNDIGCAVKNAYVCKLLKRPFTSTTGVTSTGRTTITTRTTNLDSITTGDAGATSLDSSSSWEPSRRSSADTIKPESGRTTLAGPGSIKDELRNDSLVGGMIAGFILVLIALVLGVYFYRRRQLMQKGTDDGFGNANWSKDSQAVRLDTTRSQSTGGEEAVNPSFYSSNN